MTCPSTGRDLIAAVACASVALVLMALAQPAALPSAEAMRHNNLGAALMDSGVADPKYFAEAIREFEAALAASPRYEIAEANLGVALYFAGETARAAKVLTSVLNRRPDSLHARFVLGLVRESEAAFDAAADHFRRVVDRDPADADAWYHLGFCSWRTGRHAVAVDAFRRAVTLRPYERRVRYGLFMALTRAGQKAEAEAELEALRSLDASQVRVVAGPKNSLEYLKQGRYAEAVADSRAPAPVRPASARVDATAKAGVSVGRPARDPEAEAVLAGKPTRAAWFADPAHRARVHTAAAAGAAMIDYNQDGRLDLHIVGRAGQRVFRQERHGRFVDATLAAGVGDVLKRPLAAAWGDLDNDGWPDLVLAGAGRILVMMNRQGKLAAVPGVRRNQVPAGYAAGGITLADVDHDGDLDIAVAGGPDLARPRKTGPVRYPDDFEPSPNLLLRNNRDGTFTEMAKAAGFEPAGAATLAIWFSDVDDDRAVDAILVGPRGTATVLLNQKNGTFARADRLRAPQAASMTLGTAAALGDYDRDGGIDELVVGPDGVRLNRETRPPSRWLTVRVRGYAVPGKVKSNRLGIGTRIEVRSAGLWERREIRAGNGAGGQDAPEVTFDLGTQDRLDFVRAVFPSGVRKTVTDVRPGQVLELEEPLLDVNSCPTVFTWNGRRFEFVTDTLSAGILGELVAPGQYWQPDPDEWVRIAPGQLVADRERLEIRFTNPLEEVSYLDSVKLVAIDHPASLEVYSDERMRGPAADRATTRVFAVRGKRPADRAVDHDGHDVTDVLARADRRFFDHFSPRPFKGFAGDWSLTVDLGPAAGAKRVLGLEGWSYWNSSASIVAAAQADERLWGPVLEVRDEAGRWRMATDDLGVPAGLPRTVVVDLTPYVRPGERLIRLRSNRTIYYDQVWIGEVASEAPIDRGPDRREVRTTQVPLAAARLQWLGYPRRLLPDGRLPEVFDYHDLVAEAEWGTHAGTLTRFGDVLPLLHEPDSRFVVMGHGEEVALSFDARGLPAVTPGWTRTFFLYANGFEKGYEVHSAFASTVDPLPFQGMDRYPGDPPEPSRDEAHIEYLLEWNSRPAFMRPGRLR